MFCWFLLYSKVNQPYIYIYPLFFGFPSRLSHTQFGVEFPVLYITFSLVTCFIHSINSIWASQGARRRKWQPTPVSLSGKSHEQRSLVGYSPWGRKKLGTTDWLTQLGAASGKEPACQCRRCKRRGFDPWVRKISWRRAWQPASVFLLGESHGQRAWLATVNRVAKSRTQLSDFTHTHTHQIVYICQSQSPSSSQPQYLFVDCWMKLSTGTWNFFF